MSLTQYDPFRGFPDIARTMDNFFSDFNSNINASRKVFSPRVDIKENDSTLFFTAELPGLSKENVKVTVQEGDLLTIKGEKSNNWIENNKIEAEENDATKAHESDTEKDEIDSTMPNLLREERSFGSFTRSFKLPDNIDTDSMKGKFENGMLEIELAKKEPEKPKELEIAIN